MSFARRRPEGRGSIYFDFDPPRPAPLKATSTDPKRSGRTALMWHQLRHDSAAAGRPIVCVQCLRPHVTPPAFGCCPCGSYGFGLPAAGDVVLLEVPDAQR